MSNSTLSGNLTVFQGGGIANLVGTTIVNNCTLAGNSADSPDSTSGSAGGGIFNKDGMLTVQNSTISGNTLSGAEGKGGGVFADGTTIIANTTITGNRGSGQFSPGGLYHSSGGVLTNSIVAGNFDGVGSANDIGGTSQVSPTSSYNLIGNASTAAGLKNGTNGNIVGNAGVGTLPITSILDTNLGFNGGPTRTHALASGSRAINAGTNIAGLPNDQRGPGFPRRYGARVDIGAYELQPPVLACPGDLTTTNTPGQCGALVPFTVTSDSPVTCVPASGSLFALGTNVVTCTATNAVGTNTCSFKIVVRDTQAPVLACPASFSTNAPLGSNSVRAFFAVSATDNCAVLGTNCVPPSGSFFPLGATPVTCTTWDAAGNTNTSMFTVTVLAAPAPEMGVSARVGFCDDVLIPDGYTTPSTCLGTDLGSVPISSGAAVRYFTIFNQGDAVLHITNITVSGGQAGDFTVSGLTLPAAIAPNSSTSFQIMFDPSAAGLRTTTLSILNNDADANPYTFALQGTGSCLANITVTSTNDNGAGSLRLALTNICTGGTIDFAPALHGQTIRLTSGGLVIRSDVSIVGPGATNLTIRGNGGTRVFTINSGVTGLLAGLTITDGDGGILNSGTLTVNHCAVSGNFAAGDGGGIRNAGTLAVLNSTLSGNESVGDEGGGGLHNSGTVTIENSTISGNRAPGPGTGPTGFGGGLHNFTGSMTLRHTTVAGNSANFRGDGIRLRAGTLTVSHTLLSNPGENYAANSGSVSNGGFNLASDNSAAAFAVNAGNLQLGALAFNGGPTLTHALASSSPAIDAGTTNTLPNAWQIADVSASLGSGVLAYTRTLTPVQKTISTNNGWQYTIVSRLVDGSGGSGPAHFMIHGNGTRRFLVSWDTNAAGQLVATLGGGITTNLTTAAAATNYHTHELIYDPATRQATYRFDGSNIVTWAGLNDANQNGLVQWGSASSLGRGRMNYHHVRFAINGLGTAAEYFAGYQGSPLVTPNPTNQNWTLNLPAVASAVTNAPVSPDAVALWPDASSDVALDFDQRGAGYARRAGRAVDVGAFEFQAFSTALRFVEIEPASAGMRLHLQGAPNEVLSIQRNTEPGPGGWQPLTSGATDGTGSLQYIDTSIAGQPKRFYRAVRP